MSLQQFSRILKTSSKVWMIIGIYILHLLFFEGLMAKPADFAYNYLGQISSTQKQEKNNSHNLPSDYTMLMKHENSEQLTLQVPVCFAQQTAIFGYHQVTFFTYKDLPAEVQTLRLPDDAFKRYLLLNVFLV